MAHFFKEVKGYVKAWVVDFFARMQYNDELEELETTIGGRTLVVTPDLIAEYLGYERPPPEAITYPRPGEEEMDIERINAVVFEEGEDRGGRDLKDGFRTMNKVLDYNLFPRGMEKTPYDVELELLYVFMSVEECMDYAKWIFDQLVQFKQDFKRGVNFPFPALITELCLANGLSLDGHRLDPGTPGVINATSEHKSKTNVTRSREARARAQAQAQAQAEPQPQPQLPASAQAGSQAGPSHAPTGSPPQKKGSTLKSLLCKLLCRTTEIQEDQRRANQKANFYYEQLAGQGLRRYEPPADLATDRAIGEHRSPEPQEEELTEEEIRDLEESLSPVF